MRRPLWYCHVLNIKRTKIGPRWSSSCGSFSVRDVSKSFQCPSHRTLFAGSHGGTVVAPSYAYASFRLCEHSQYENELEGFLTNTRNKHTTAIQIAVLTFACAVVTYLPTKHKDTWSDLGFKTGVNTLRFVLEVTDLKQYSRAVSDM